MKRYYYLIYSLFFVGLALLVYFSRKDLRQNMQKAAIWGLFAGPAAELIYFQDYWKPVTILGKGKISVEDFLVHPV